MFVRIAAFFIALYMLIPIIVVVVTAFGNSAYPVFPPTGLTLHWFEKVWSSSDLRDSALISAKLSFAATVLATCIGTLSAIALMRFNWQGKKTVSAFLLSPIYFPAIVLGLALLVFFNRIGLANTFTSLVLAHTVLATPFVIRLVMASLAEVDWTLEEAARNLGAGPYKAFFAITLPIILPGVIAGAIFAFIISFDEVVVTLFLTNAGMQTLPVRIYNYIEYQNDPTISAVSTCIIAIWLIIGIPAYKRFLSPHSS